MLLELCVTELEDVATDRVCGRLPQPVVQESPHPYMDDASLSGTVKIPGKLRLIGQEKLSKQGVNCCISTSIFKLTFVM